MARRARGDRGAVTAELALGLPVLLAITVGLVWVLALGVHQVRVTDAARESARSLARGDSVAVAVGHGRRVAPPGADVEVTRGDGTIVARVRSRVTGPGGLLRFLGPVTVDAEAVALDESAR